MVGFPVHKIAAVSRHEVQEELCKLFKLLCPFCRQIRLFGEFMLSLGLSVIRLSASAFGRSVEVFPVRWW